MLNETRINKLNRILLVIFLSLQPALQLLLDLFEDKAFAIFGISFATIIRYTLFGSISFLAIVFNIEKKSTKLFISYVFICIVYIILQYFNTRNFDSTAYYGNSGQSFLSCVMENSKYVLPVSLIFIVYIVKPSLTQIKTAIYVAATFVVIQLIVTNLLGVDRISYKYGSTDNPVGNIIAWFSNSICVTDWKLYTSRGLYASGNALSGFFSLTLPVVFFLALKSRKVWCYLLVLFQMIGMLMVGTRVSVYGAILIFVAIICIWLFDFIFNKKKISYKRVTSIVMVFVIFGTFFIYSPFIARLKSGNDKTSDYIDMEDMSEDLSEDEMNDFDSSLESDSSESTSSSPEIDLEQNNSDKVYSKEYKQNFILKYYAKNGIQSSYIYNVYNYKEQTDFWYNLMTKVEFSKRNTSRKIKGLILNDITENKGDVLDRIVGIGHIGIYPEADFSAIYYYNGILGWALFVLPYIVILVWSVIRCLMLLYKRKFNSFNYVLILSLGFTMISALLAGHILSTAYISSFIGMVCGVLVMNLAKTKGKSGECLDA